MSSETIAAAASSALGTRRLRHPPAATASFLSFRLRPAARLPGVVAASASASASRRCKAKAHGDDQLGN